MNNFTERQTTKLFEAENPIQLCEKAKELGIDLTQEKAEVIFPELKNVERVSVKLKALSISDQEKFESLLSNCNDSTEVINVFKTFDIEINEQVAQSVLKSRTEGTELSDEDLDQVAGGFIGTATVIAFAAGFLFSVLS